MSLPQSITLTHPNQVCKFLKYLYGPKQSSRQWFTKLSHILLSHNFTQCPADHSLFIHKSSSKFTVIVIYVDDLIIAGNNIDIINHIK